jgi:hypothetical protein
LFERAVRLGDLLAEMRRASRLVDQPAGSGGALAKQRHVVMIEAR